ncbi:MAG: hypothetical protein M3R36_09920 [Bacteroidota bacterium]|nr:hypothetical protein [Bacteroidota bacterium]
MKIFKKLSSGKIFFLIYILSLLPGCNEISQGLQRRKFEFLYKLNNYASIFREYTNEISSFKDIEFYQGRMKKLYEDINNVKPVEGYGQSRVLKDNFLTAIDENINTINSFQKKSFQPDSHIRKEYDIIIMNERADNFIKELNDEISKIGKE